MGLPAWRSNLYKFNNNCLIGWLLNYDAELLKKFGGFVEGQYYFTNQWFVNAVYGVSKAYGVSRARYASRVNGC